MGFSGSGAVRAIKQGDFQATIFAGTAVGVQSALDFCEGGGGGTVAIDGGLNIQVSSASIKIPNRVRLIGHGEGGTLPTFKAANGAALSAIVENKTQDGTQEYAWVERININGNSSSATVTSGLKFAGVYANSAIKDCVVTSVSGDGIVIEGTSGGGPHGPVYMENIWSLLNGGHNILIEGPGGCDVLTNIISERPGTGKSCVRIHNSGGSTSFGHVLTGIYMECSDATAVGIDLEGCADTLVQNAKHNGAGIASVVKIRGVSVGSSGLFGSSGHTIFNIYGGGSTVLVDDQVSGVTVSASQHPCCHVYICPKQVGAASASFGGQIVGLQMQRQAVDVTAASTIDLDAGNFAVVVGNTAIDNISNAARYCGKIATIRTSGTPTIRHNSGGIGNIRLLNAVDLSMTAGSMIQFISDGTLWTEVSRSAASPTILQPVGNITAATDVTLASGNYFVVSGATPINTINPTEGGRIIYLRFNDASAPTVNNHGTASGNLYLAGGVDFVATQTDILTLVGDGSGHYVEVCRSVN